MKGADGYYNLIDKADKLKIGDLKRITCYGYGYGFKHKNIVFVLSTHARGKCFKIWIYENENIKDTLKDNHLEVYGITCGEPGWTDTYGWLYNGSWVKYIINYFQQLEKLIYEEGHKNKIAADKTEEIRKKNIQNKIDKLDNIFSQLI